MEREQAQRLVVWVGKAHETGQILCDLVKSCNADPRRSQPVEAQIGISVWALSLFTGENDRQSFGLPGPCHAFDPIQREFRDVPALGH